MRALFSAWLCIIHSGENFPLRESHDSLTDLSSRTIIGLSTGCAFDAVFAMLRGAQYPDQVREVIADRVLEFGRTSNESNPRRLACAAVASLGIKL